MKQVPFNQLTGTCSTATLKYFVNIMQKHGSEMVNTQVTGTVVSYPLEYVVHNADEALLTQLSTVSGGKFDPKPEDTFRTPEQPVMPRIHL